MTSSCAFQFGDVADNVPVSGEQQQDRPPRHALPVASGRHHKHGRHGAVRGGGGHLYRAEQRHGPQRCTDRRHQVEGPLGRDVNEIKLKMVNTNNLIRLILRISRSREKRLHQF